MEEINNTVTQSISENYYVADMHVRMAHKATGRTYWAFSATIVAVVATITVLFNHYWSYEELMFKKMNIFLREGIGETNSDFSKKDTILFGQIKQDELIESLKKNEIKDLETLEFGEPNPISKSIREHYIRNHIDSMYITIPLFGIKISVNDILILMGLTFLVLAIWLFFCIRSENFTIGKIVSLNQNTDVNIRSYVFYGICFNNLFFPTTQRFTPYRYLYKKSDSFDEELKEIPTKKRQKRNSYHKHFIFFIPTIIMIGNFIFHIDDITSKIFDEKKYTTVEYKNEKYFIDDAKIARFDFHDYNMVSPYNPYKNRLQRIIFLSSILIGFTLFFAIRTSKYQDGTNQILYLFKRRFKHDEDCQKKAKLLFHNLQGKTKKIEIVDKNSRMVFSQKKRFADYKKKFSEEYSTENYYFLTHTGCKEEAQRIKQVLEEAFRLDNSKLFLEKCKEKCKGKCKRKGEDKDKEYFIFIKVE